MLSVRSILTAVRSISTSVPVANGKGGSSGYVHLQGASKRKMALLQMKHREQDKKGGKHVQEQEIAVEDRNEMDAYALTHIPEDQHISRTFRIFRPAKSAMQSGHYGGKKWHVELENQEKWENPTIGWASSADPLSNISMTMTFKSKEDAIRFVERQGFQCYVDENPTKRMQAKVYGINFSWDKRTRRGMK